MCMLMMGYYWHIQQRTLYKLHSIVSEEEGKVLLVCVMKAYRGNRCISPIVLTVNTT
jgi:DNA-binding protein Fis